MTKNELKEFISDYEKISIPFLQRQLGLSYAQAKTAVQALLKSGDIAKEEGIMYKVVSSKRIVRPTPPPSSLSERFARLAAMQRERSAYIKEVTPLSDLEKKALWLCINNGIASPMLIRQGLFVMPSVAYNTFKSLREKGLISETKPNIPEITEKEFLERYGEVELNDDDDDDGDEEDDCEEDDDVEENFFDTVDSDELREILAELEDDDDDDDEDDDDENNDDENDDDDEEDGDFDYNEEEEGPFDNDLFNPLHPLFPVYIKFRGMVMRELGSFLTLARVEGEGKIVVKMHKEPIFKIEKTEEGMTVFPINKIEITEERQTEALLILADYPTVYFEDDTFVARPAEDGVIPAVMELYAAMERIKRLN